MSQPAEEAAVDFHSGVVDKFRYTERLLMKAAATMPRIWVVGASDLMAQLSQRLWGQSDVSFWAHALLPCESDVRSRSRLLLVGADLTPEDESVNHDLVIHWGGWHTDALTPFARAVELVGLSDDERQAGRARWREYEAMGCALRHFNANT